MFIERNTGIANSLYLITNFTCNYTIYLRCSNGGCKRRRTMLDRVEVVVAGCTRAGSLIKRQECFKNVSSLTVTILSLEKT